MTAPKVGEFSYEGLKTGIFHLKQGHTKLEGSRPLDCDITYLRDQFVPLRDGKRLWYVFRNSPVLQ